VSSHFTKESQIQSSKSPFPLKERFPKEKGRVFTSVRREKRTVPPLSLGRKEKRPLRERKCATNTGGGKPGKTASRDREKALSRKGGEK